ncbi:hypothetical protein HU200_016992 [Digitaria exilis]|uniref:Uncharacterized protein n=1 Tax=Digitaria exilis TaxID=1010633 RepID=A0A835KI83_9POAL|nr:hypothetical protein HU200_016992 [Digitaria exilis]
MSPFFRGGAAALAAAAAVGLSYSVISVSWKISSPQPPSSSPASSPSTPAGPAAAAATGHLALVRAHPCLRDLSAMLTPASFLIDATQALLAGALRRAPLYPGTFREVGDYVIEQILSAESEGHAAALQDQVNLAVLDARGGYLDEALNAITRLAAEHPRDTTTRIYAAAFCHVLGRQQEGCRWLRDSPVLDLSHLDLKMLFAGAVLVSTLGSSPRAVAGSEELVLRSTLGLLELAMWSIFQHGDLQERLQVLAFMAFLRGVVERKLVRDVGPPQLKGSQDASSPRAS